MGSGSRPLLAKMGGILGFAMEMTRRGSVAIPKPEIPTIIPGAWKPAHNAGSHISTATTAADLFQQ